MALPIEREAFFNFVRLNAARWQSEDEVLAGRNSADVLLIDLLSHDIQLHSTRALYIAKLVQKETGCRLVGVIGNLLISRRLQFPYNKPDIIRLARSYGITDFIDLETGTFPDETQVDSDFISSAETQSVIASAHACSDEKLADAVLEWRTPDGCRIGEYIHDSTLRISRDPVLAHTRPLLDDVTREAHKICNIISAYCSANQVKTIVAGHLIYAQWGLIVDLVLRRGGQAIWFDNVGNFSAYLLKRPPGRQETLSSLVREIDRNFFEQEFKSRARFGGHLVEKLARLFSGEQFLTPYWWKTAKLPPPQVGPKLREIVLSKLGWANTDLPVVCVFLHCFADGPRDDIQIHRDYYVWMIDTLEIAKRDTSKRWIFKEHPANKGTYDLTDTMERVRRDYGGLTHVRFLGQELSRAELFSVCDVAVTVRGSISYEFPLAGTPVLLAGRSFQSDFGFCHVANSESEYETMLTSRFSELSLSKEMEARSKFYFFYDRMICRIESSLMPYWTYELTGGENLWNALSERILHSVIDLDPAALSVKAMLEGGPGRTVNPLIDRLAAGTKSADLASLPSPTSGVTCQLGDKLIFGRDGNGASYLLSSGWRDDENGTWFAAGNKALIGFVLPGASRSAGLLLRFNGPPSGSMLAINVNGAPARQIPLSEGYALIDQIDAGGTKSDFDQVIILEMRLLNSDQVQVEFCLMSIEVNRMDELQTRAKQDSGKFAVEAAQISRIEVGDYGPRETLRGDVFNKQPNGTAGMWFRTQPHAPQNSYVVFDEVPLRTLIIDALVTAEVSPDLLQNPRKVEVTLALDGQTIAGPVSFTIND